MSNNRDKLTEEAISILKTNDRGGYTVPSAGLYPYQWNWDSAFVALGFAEFDRPRAWSELEMLVEGQWANGMIPHILFRRRDEDYFPGVNTWKTSHLEMPSSGISQPPVLASVVLALVRSGDEADLSKAKQLYQALVSWHRWFYTDRVCDTKNVLGTVHPWETGRDNSPDWNLGLDAMTVDPDLEAYTRTDLSHAAVSERPSHAQYDRYITIVKFGRDHNWDQKILTNEGPFLMADPCIHFILLRANRDLLVLAKLLNEGTQEIESWIQHGVSTSDYLWNEELGAYTARNLRNDEFSNGFSSASALCFYAGVGSKEQQLRTLENIDRIQKKVGFLLPSWDPDHADFESQRYWCGPVWPQMNQIISQGLIECDYQELGLKLKNDLASTIEKSGFWECFNPESGEGCVGQHFSWTAAAWLSWASK